ncbi:OpgC family protein [Oryzibacter oryziterrae]|uniref:OpgC family protein n=1 Tax=Oryzibacter oryziterrae TaxID=2766474 RepID=UPI001F476B99|nr:OpgC domain-containing protein [Oryzibacter oryziterrae]
MSVQSLGARDHRIDILRSLALISIFINHIPGNVLEPYTHKNFGMSDSAEAFVLLAGVAAAFAYFPRFSAGEYLLTVGKVLKRVVTLYIAHLASISVGLGLFCYAAMTWQMPIDDAGLNIWPIFKDPMAALVGIPLMTQQIGYHNILPLYVCLLLFLPVLMVAARIHLGAMLALSLTVYALAQVYVVNMSAYPREDGGWFFNPFTWQLIFAIGFFVGTRVLKREVPVPYSLPLWLAAFGYLILTGVIHRYNLYAYMPEVSWLPHNFQVNEKPWVAWPRLLHILSLAYVICYSPVMRWLGLINPRNPLARVGRHSLPVFWLGTMLAVVGQIFFFVADPGVVAQLAYLAVGVGAQIALAYVLDGLAKTSRSRVVHVAEQPVAVPAE